MAVRNGQASLPEIFEPVSELLLFHDERGEEHVDGVGIREIRLEQVSSGYRRATSGTSPRNRTLQWICLDADARCSWKSLCNNYHHPSESGAEVVENEFLFRMKESFFENSNQLFADGSLRRFVPGPPEPTVEQKVGCHGKKKEKNNEKGEEDRMDHPSLLVAG